ncbi:MAG: TetR/AcrR family transcriptional regulator [Synoicihabitans sp.]
MGRTSDADQRLMDAALYLLWGESYGSVTIDDICQRADVRKGSFYYFYDSKSDLAVKALDRMWQSFRPELETMFDPSIPPLERIRNTCQATYAHQLELKEKYGRVLGCVLCSLGSEIGNRDDAIRDKVRTILESKKQYWITAVADAQDAGLIEEGDTTGKVRCAMAFAEGLLAQARLHNDLEHIADLADRVCEQLIARQPVSSL